MINGSITQNTGGEIAAVADDSFAGTRLSPTASPRMDRFARHHRWGMLVTMTVTAGKYTDENGQFRSEGAGTTTAAHTFIGLMVCTGTFDFDQDTDYQGSSNVANATLDVASGTASASWQFGVDHPVGKPPWTGRKCLVFPLGPDPSV
ncbi:MAG: hypothetical protein U5O39_11900 [Gammaproteobacteria bacterium]|nr:hypothetical protein [Gammaproteobacteria bacterium]